MFVFFFFFWSFLPYLIRNATSITDRSEIEKYSEMRFIICLTSSCSRYIEKQNGKRVMFRQWTIIDSTTTKQIVVFRTFRRYTRFGATTPRRPKKSTEKGRLQFNIFPPINVNTSFSLLSSLGYSFHDIKLLLHSPYLLVIPLIIGFILDTGF